MRRDGYIHAYGKTYDMSKRCHRLQYWWRELRFTKPRDVCWRIADYLSRVACWLRGHKWYVADTWHGVPGNRAAELRQRVWVNAVLLANFDDEIDMDRLNSLDRDLSELAQAAGENWGHIEPNQELENEHKKYTSEEGRRDHIGGERQRINP